MSQVRVDLTSLSGFQIDVPATIGPEICSMYGVEFHTDDLRIALERLLVAIKAVQP